MPQVIKDNLIVIGIILSLLIAEGYAALHYYGKYISYKQLLENKTQEFNDLSNRFNSYRDSQSVKTKELVKGAVKETEIRLKIQNHRNSKPKECKREDLEPFTLPKTINQELDNEIHNDTDSEFIRNILCDYGYAVPSLCTPDRSGGFTATDPP